MASYTTYFQQARQFEQQGEWQQAIDCYTRALAIHPDPAEAYYHIGRAESRLGRGEQAIRAFQKAIEIQPDFARAWHDMVVEISNLLFRLNYQELSREAVFERHKTWAARIEAPLAPFITSHAHDKTPNRKLRVGFVSRDFYTHSVSYFLNGLFTAFDRTAFEFFCYSDTAVPDRVTERFKSLVSSFRDTRALSHLMLANVIREDRIHILVDLAGHSGNNRLCAFAMKPAPIQVTYLGYPNTTGFSTMDYRIVDDITDPEGDGDRFASERLFRLPRGFLCYTPFDPPPETDIAPAMQSGPITFGSFNISGKISKKTARLWSAILKAVPASRLFLKCRAYDDPRHKNHILSLFQDHQIPAERILFSGWVRDQADHLRCYNRMDIALDTFPYTGTTTTCEALLMGVPVITLKGESHAARVSTSILTHAGLDDLIAGSPEAYIDKAVALAGNRQRLAHYKTTLRQTFMDSPVMATQLFTRQMETAFRRIWEIWCGPDQTGPEKNVCSPPPKESTMMNTHDNAIPFADYFNQKGETAFSAGDMDNARRAFEKALRIFPHHIDAMNNMGVLHWQRKDYKKALDCFDTILRQHPDHGDAQHNRDQVLQAMDAGDNRFQGKHPEARLKIRILHSLTGPGGEMVAACIGSMKNVLLLHDIHPLKVTTPQALVTSDIVRKKLTMEHHPVPPRYQPESWTDAIKYLARTGEENDHHLVMHVPADMDFFEMPNAPAPTHGFSSIDALIGEFEIIQAVAVCHPITQYNHLSTGQQALSSLAVPQFLKGYRRFAEQVQAMAYIRLEDVTQIPVIALKTLCRQLDLSFDPDFFHKWHEYNLESGDYPAKSSDRHLPPGAEAFKGNRPVDTRLSDEFTGNPDFKKAISLLGYGQTAP